MRKSWKWMKIAIIIYCVIGIALYYLQDYILFHPVKVTQQQTYNFTIPHKEINIQYSANSTINIAQFLVPDSLVTGVVLYFHGNKKNISWYSRFSPYFTRNGYEVWMIDYPGFGKSTGTFSEQRLYDWALTLYKLARARFSPDSIIIYGKSMGTGIAAQLASIRDCRYLILETPYYNMPSIIDNYLPIYPVNKMIHYKLPTWQYLQNVTAPVTIFHGTGDWVIPYRNAERLKPFLKSSDQFITIDDGSHNDLYKFPLVINKLDSLLKK
ncbi:MAG: alpha/beta fold hydrolase [Chitinophagaceae bacterium]|nr:alpha/beta fold hydrolase [Chitinophagaceae bacterium]